MGSLRQHVGTTFLLIGALAGGGRAAAQQSGASFFDPAGGGEDPGLGAWLLWALGHPEVYLVIAPGLLSLGLLALALIRGAGAGGALAFALFATLFSAGVLGRPALIEAVGRGGLGVSAPLLLLLTGLAATIWVAGAAFIALTVAAASRRIAPDRLGLFGLAALLPAAAAWAFSGWMAYRGGAGAYHDSSATLAQIAPLLWIAATFMALAALYHLWRAFFLTPAPRLTGALQLGLTMLGAVLFLAPQVAAALEGPPLRYVEPGATAASLDALAAPGAGLLAAGLGVMLAMILAALWRRARASRA